MVPDENNTAGTRNNIALMMDIAEIELENLKLDEEQWGINPKKERKLRKIRDILRTMP